ncbi:hypothetical protein SERLA73DRAFT_24382, partial [Serpula lacrymans var. lacrymans S7.3]
MIPKFINPHFRTEQSAIVSRNEIHADEDIRGPETCNHDPLLIRRLEKLVQDNIESTAPPRKRRKIEKLGEQDAEDTTTFCLVSRTPKTISLQPKPPPLLIIQEPSCEDSESEADQRMKRAQSVAVDFAWVIKESQIPPAKLVRAKTNPCLSKPPPAIMVTEESKPVRIPGFVARRFAPHILDTSPADVPEEKARCPVIHIQSDAHASSLKAPDSHRRKKRRALKERPPPTFWRPDPSWRGKCQGYAIGYPGHWSGY